MSRYLYKKIQNISPESLNFQHSGLKLTILGSDCASSKGYIVRWVEAPSNKLLTTAFAPVITNVKVSGSTIKVTYKAAANATGYDVVLGTGSKKENGETRPYQYGNHKKLNFKEGTVTATFKNVPKGTWVVGMHAFNRTSEDGKKVFSPWSNLKKATVK